MIELTEDQVTLIDVVKNIRKETTRLPEGASVRYEINKLCDNLISILAYNVSNQLIEKLTGKGT